MLQLPLTKHSRPYILKACRGEWSESEGRACEDLLEGVETARCYRGYCKVCTFSFFIFSSSFLSPGCEEVGLTGE